MNDKKTPQELLEEFPKMERLLEELLENSNEQEKQVNHYCSIVDFEKI